MTYRWLALGDSYTIGEGVPEADRWPVQAAARLRADGLGVTPDIVAVTGWTAADLLTGLDAASIEGPVDVVTLLIGVNDEYDGVEIGTYRANVRTLLDRATALTGDAATVLVVSIPDWSVTPFARESGRDLDAIARAVEAFNVVARDAARASGASWLDITPLTRDQGALVVEDGLHPSGAAYGAWAQLATPRLRALLRSARSAPN